MLLRSPRSKPPFTLAAVQRGYEQDIVSLLNLILLLALELPVCLVDEDQNARPAATGNQSGDKLAFPEHLHGIIQYEHVFSRIFHDIIAQMPHQICHIRGLARLISCRYVQRQFALVLEEHFQASAFAGEKMG